MKKILLALLLTLFAGFAQAQVTNINPFTPCGLTVTITAATSAPSPVQATCGTGSQTQYVVTNTGSVVAYISYGSSAQATTNCVIPTSTGQNVYVILPLSQITMTTGGASFFCALTATSTAVIYIQPGTGT